MLSHLFCVLSHFLPVPSLTLGPTEIFQVIWEMVWSIFPCVFCVVSKIQKATKGWYLIVIRGARWVIYPLGRDVSACPRPLDSSWLHQCDKALNFCGVSPTLWCMCALSGCPEYLPLISCRFSVCVCVCRVVGCFRRWRTMVFCSQLCFLPIKEM